MEALTDLGFVGILSFGSVAILSYFVKSFKGYEFGSREKAVALVIFAFAYGFVPVEFGNIIAERIKDAIYVGASITAIYTGAKNIAEKIG